jgi:hypothetical protein
MDARTYTTSTLAALTDSFESQWRDSSMMSSVDDELHPCATLVRKLCIQT